ncbi:MAG: NADH:ubiquinone reductase (Na(+)-transporting) subunit D [Deltaproteobacteria bacterium]|nr:NADH:ubiquinone reductase (Na(+)-transporting) subunit D [Deltaproteobacteria bacterium]
MSVAKQIKEASWQSNPVAFQVLGICSALAVTVNIENALVMGAAVTAVLSGSNVIISALRNAIPTRIRIIVQLSIVSTLVIVVDQVLQAYLFDVSKQLSVFVGLIITNCIILGRAEAYAMANPPLPSFWDAIGNSLGYTWVLVLVAVARELFGKGELLGFKVIPQAAYSAGYVNNGLMVLAPAAFILLGLIIWGSKALGGAKGE